MEEITVTTPIMEITILDAAMMREGNKAVEPKNHKISNKGITKAAPKSKVLVN